MPDLGPMAVTLLVLISLLVLGLFLLLLAEGPKVFLDSFLRGLAAIRSRWKIYLLDLTGFFSLIAFGLGLMASIIAVGAMVYFLVHGPRFKLEDYRLYLPPVWTVFWLCILLACNSLSEQLQAQADDKPKN
ncbi:MAG: hypothetical protein PHE84_14530 [bacterium]|nr:hypothetical protein [bacterium]